MSAEKEIIHVNTNNIIIKNGKDQYIEDINGKKYLDLRMGAGTMILGHSNDYIVDKIKEQVDKGILFASKCENEEILSNLLEERMPWYSKFIYCNSGSESIMRLFRIARSYTKKNKVAVLSGNWHGSYDQVLIDENMDISDKCEIKVISDGLSKNVLDDVIILPNDIEEIRKIIINNNDIAMVLVEPVQQNVPDLNVKHFLNKLKQITVENNILLGFDEIITGFRFIPNSSQKYFDVYSDLACFGKIISGGLPFGVIGIKKEIEEHLNNINKPVYFGGTFSGNPLSTCIAYHTIKYLIENNNIYDDIEEKITNLANEINDHCVKNSIDAQIMHAKYFFRIIFTNKKITTKKNRHIFEKNYKKQKEFYTFMAENNIFIGTNPLCFISIKHTKEDLLKIKETIIRGFNKFI